MNANDKEVETLISTGNDDHTMGVSKQGRGLIRAWSLISRITLILYLCASIVAYVVFSRDQLEACFGLCDRMPVTTELQIGSESPSFDLPQSQSQPTTSVANDCIEMDWDGISL